MLMTVPDRGGLQAVDTLDIVGHFGVRTPVEVNLITKKLSFYKELKLWFSAKTIDCNCDTRLLSC